MTAQRGTPVLEARGLSKNFGAVRALIDADFQLYEKEIVGLVGDNGAGKSTLIKCFAGVLTPDAGRMFLYGHPLVLHGPHDARTKGIETVYQDLAVINSLGVAENLFLGREKTRGLFWGWPSIFLASKEMRADCERVLSELAIRLKSVRQDVGRLSGGQRQAIAIARSAMWRGRVVLMDEPTAALGVRESAHALEIMERLRAAGSSLIAISHNLEHVFAAVDRIVVLRHGRVCGVRMKKETTKEEIVGLITGAVAADRDRCAEDEAAK